MKWTLFPLVIRLIITIQKIHGLPLPSSFACGDHGVTCSVGSTINRIDINNTYSGGSIPSVIGTYTGLSYLNLGDNSLNGSIPTETGLLTQLEYIDLHSNSLSGSFPTEIGLLTKLIYLDLNSNSLSGIIPSEMRQLTQISFLNLVFNSLSGTIPTEIGLLTKLSLLALGYNALSGSIPTEIRLLTQLLGLILGTNSISGSIPTEMGLLTHLSFFDLSRNSLSGTIPTEMGLLTQLRRLDLFSNSLSGTIPTEIGLLAQLSSLTLSFNPLSSSIPSEIGLLAQLSSLAISFNSLFGSIPTEMGLLTQLSSLAISFNSLSGSIPTEMGLLTQLMNLDLSFNSFCDLIPAKLLEECPLNTCITGYDGTATCKPSPTPTISPSVAPSTIPSTDPSVAPSTIPSTDPSITPSARPSFLPSFRPSDDLVASISIPTSSGDINNGNSPSIVVAVVVSVVVVLLFIAAIFASRYWDHSYAENEEADVAAPSIVSGVSHYCVCWGHGNLLRAASEGNVDRVRRCIERGCDVNNTRDKNGWTALHIAAKRGHLEVLNFLIDKRADLEARNNIGWSSLHIAAKYGHVPTLNELLEKNADGEAKTSNGSTALQIAAIFGNKTILEALIEKYSDLESKDNNGWTALHWACFCKQIEVAKVLLDKQCDVSIQDRDGKTAVHIAASEGSVELLNALLEKNPNLEAKDYDGQTALHSACISEREEIVKVLLSKKVNALAKDSKNRTPLDHARARSISILGLLESYIQDKMTKYMVENYKIEITKNDSRILFGTFLASQDTHDVIIKLPMEAGTLSKKALSKEAEIYKRIACKRDNETFVPLFWDFTEDPAPYLVIEKFGHDLRTHMIKVKDRSKIFVNKIIVEVLNAVSFLHHKGYIHTDIKPANILIDTSVEVRVKLCDLESATEFGQEVMFGTKSWMAPEIHFQTDLKATPAVDMFSIGLVVAFLYDTEFRETVLPDNGISLDHVYRDQTLLDACLSCNGTSDQDTKIFIRNKMCNIDRKSRAATDIALSKFDTRRTAIINEKLAAIYELEKMKREYEDKLKAQNSPEEIKKVIAEFFKSLLSTVDSGIGIKDKFENDIIMNHISEEMRIFQESQNKTLESAIGKIDAVSDSVKYMKECFFQMNQTIASFRGYLMREIESKHQNVLELLGSMRTQMSDAATIQQGLLGPEGIPTLMIAIPELSSSIKDWFKNPYKLFENDVRVFFICQYTLRIVKCGPDGKGFLFRQAKKWVQATAPILKAGLILLQIGLVVGTGVSIPFADLIPGFNSCLNEEKLQFIAACTLSLAILTDAYTIGNFDDTSSIPDKFLLNKLNSKTDDTSIKLSIQQLIESTRDNKFQAYSDVKEYFKFNNITIEEIRAFSGLKPVKHRSSGDVFWIAHDVSDEEFENSKYSFKPAGKNL